MNRLLNPTNLITLLRNVGCSSSLIRHCEAVSNLSVKLAQRLKNRGKKVDVELVRIGGLLHDIGRSKTHGLDHAVIGADILRHFTFPTPVIQIVERHIGSGIPADEALELGLPKRDFIPETLEEKIVSYADKLIEDNREISFDEALQRLSKEFGESSALVTRFKRIHTEIFN